MIKVWQSYSCNNSSSYRLIARFTDAAGARDAVAALLDAIELHRGDERSPLQGLARKYGFNWEDEGWGGPEDGPHALADDELVIVHHDYCLGFGPGIPALLAERGGVVEKETWADIQITVLFRWTHGVDPRLDSELSLLLAQVGADGRRPNEPKIDPIVTPWSDIARGPVSMFRDAGAFGMHIPIKPRDLPRIKAWLAGNGIDGAVIRFDEPADETLFAALATARCSACNGRLEYFDPRIHDIETPQLVCRPCGGLYELATFLPV